MELVNACSLSTLALLSDLTDGDWRTAYTALLDLTGIFRNRLSNEQLSVRTLVLDTVAELHLAGRTCDARNLLSLASSCDNPALLVLLRCSRSRGGGGFGNRKSAFYIAPSNDASHDSLFPFRASGRTDFSGLGTLDSPETTRLIARGHEASPFVPMGYDDCIESAARFAQEQNRSWLSSRLKKTVGEADLKRDELDKDVKFVALFKAKHERTNGYGTLNPFPSADIDRISGCQVQNSQVHDDALLEHIFNKCITGSYNLRQDTTLLSLSDPTESSIDWEDSLHRRKAAAAKRKEVRIYLASQKERKGEIFDSTTRAIMCGNVYQDVLTFAEIYTGAGSGRVFEAVADYAFELSRKYICALYESAYVEDVAAGCRPWLILEVAESHMSGLVALSALLKDIEQTDRSANAVLNKLYDAGPRYSENGVYRELLSKAISPYAASVKDWMLYGSLRRDVSGEFFGYGLGIQVTASESLHHSEAERYCARDVHTSAVVPKMFELEEALFVLRAGRSRELLKQFYRETETNSSAQKSVPGCLCPWSCDEHISSNQSGKSIDFHNNIHCKEQAISFEVSPDIVGTGVREASFENRNSIAGVTGERNTAHQGKCFVVPMSSSPSSPAEDRHLRLFSETSSKSDFQISSHLPGCTLSRPNSTLLPPLTATQFSNRFLSPLRPCDNAVQRQVLKYFTEQLRVFDHFRNLRAHVLLGAGDFANILVDQIDAAARLSEEHEKYIQRRANASLTFYGTSGPGVRSIRDQTHLNRCLEMALNLYSQENSEIASCISLDAADDDISRKVSLWETTIEVNYRVGYPLNLLFSDEVRQMYSRIFNLMLRILRAKKSLRSLFMMSRRKSALRRREQARCLSNIELQCNLWHFCWEAEHFVTIFGGFEMDQVLGSAWNGFESSWDAADTIWDLRDAHVHYLTDCIRRCLLGVTHKSVLGVMSGGFDIIVNVDKQISSAVEEASVLTGTSARDTIDLLSSSSASLRRRIVFLTDVLKRLLDEGMSAHLEDLLIRLSFGKQNIH